MNRKLLTYGGVLVFAASIRAQTLTDSVPEANPARPTVSTPSTLTRVGYLQFETGSLGATSSPEFDTRVGINEVTKLTVLPRLEFFVQTEPYIHSSSGGDNEIHPGEVFVGAQTVLVQGDDAHLGSTDRGSARSSSGANILGEGDATPCGFPFGQMMPRLSRHHYDLSRLYRHEYGQAAIKDLGLLASVVEHKKVFFREAAARYDLARPGSLRACLQIPTYPNSKRLPGNAPDVLWGGSAV